MLYQYYLFLLFSIKSQDIGCSVIKLICNYPYYRKLNQYYLKLMLYQYYLFPLFFIKSQDIGCSFMQLIYTVLYHYIFLPFSLILLLIHFLCKIISFIYYFAILKLTHFLNYLMKVHTFSVHSKTSLNLLVFLFLFILFMLNFFLIICFSSFCVFSF